MNNYSDYLTDGKLLELVRAQKRENPDFKIQILNGSGNPWGDNYTVTDDAEILIGVY